MKKLSILVIGLLLVAGFASAEVTLSLSGDSTLTWGIKGNLIDNTQFGDGAESDLLYTDDSGEHELTPDEVILTMEAMDGDLVIVRAESKFKFSDFNTDFSTDIVDHPVDKVEGSLTTEENVYKDAFQFIEFPNVIPGMVGIRLNKADTLDTDVTTKKSASNEPNILVTATPIDGLTAKLGVLFEQFGLERVGTITVDYATYIDFAASVFAEYVLSLGDEDSVTVAVGTVFDTAWGNTTVSELNGSVLDQVRKPWNVVATTAATPNPEDTYGYASMPVGLSVDADVAGLTASADLEVRLVNGADILDLDNAGVVRPSWAMPIFAGADLAYELDLDGITVTPSANFKYSSDYWRWGQNGDQNKFEYKGNVQAAEFLGYPMSAGVGVKVAGIADILDVDLSGSVGFGDGEYVHGTGYIYADAYRLLLGYPGAHTMADLLNDLTTGAPDTANVNDGFLAGTSPLAYELSLGLTATPMDAVTITNTTAFSQDTIGILGFTDPGDLIDIVPWDTFVSQIKNDTKATYDLMIGDAAVATFFGELNVKINNLLTEDGQTLTTADAVTDTEQESKMTVGYKIGVQVKVSTP